MSSPSLVRFAHSVPASEPRPKAVGETSRPDAPKHRGISYILCPMRWHALSTSGQSRRWHVRAYAEAELLGLASPGHAGADLWRIHRLHAVGPEVLCGLRFFAEEAVDEVLAFLRDFAPSAPREVFAGCTLRTAPPAPFLPAEVHGTRVIGLGMF